MTVHAFVDEGKHNGFVQVAAVVLPRDLSGAGRQCEFSAEVT
ncbi:MAG TPA: hypothetical protein VHV82_04565 [Sporichthyaceae bacterium]|jgi:hypothetical protein|nr:hypothetical protein [Sporichthyaceae bacterium]